MKTAINPITAEEIVGAALDMGMRPDLLDALMAEFEATDWVRIGNRAYPPCYAYALGRYRCHPDAVRRLRGELRRIPRVRAQDYDILFNVDGSHPYLEGPSWDVVKWMRIPEPMGWLPGHGYTAVILLDPYPVYAIPATRDPLSLSDWDFNQLRRNATTRGRGGEGLNEELMRNNLRKQAERKALQEAADLEFAEYYRDAFKREAEELGV